MTNFLVFLVLLIPGTDTPTIALLMPFHSAKECNVALASAPKDGANKFACIKIDLAPLDEGKAI